MSKVRKGNTEYRDYTRTYVICAVVYVVFSNYSGQFGQTRKELFPFFNWGLFTNATQYEVQYPTLFVEKLNGVRLSPPVRARELRDRFPKDAKFGLHLRKAMASLSHAIEMENHEDIERYRLIIERVYLAGPAQVTFSIRDIRYRPLVD